MKVQELFASEKNWCRGFLAIKKNGETVGLGDRDFNDAQCYCLLGGLIRCYGLDNTFKTIRDRIEDHVGIRVTLWNDASERTFADIQKLVKELDI